MWLLTFSLGAVAALTVGGNLYVMLCIAFKDKLRKVRSNLFVASLAATDFVVGLIVMPFTIAQLHDSGYHEHAEWQHGNSLCTLWILADMVACNASIWNLAAIALDRLMALVLPIHYMNLTRTSAILIIVFVWLLSFAFCIAISIDYQYCKNSDMTLGVLVFTILAAFYLPLILILICYTVVFVRIKTKIEAKVTAKMEQMELLAINSAAAATAATTVGQARMWPLEGGANRWDTSRKTSATSITINPPLSPPQSRLGYRVAALLKHGQQPAASAATPVISITSALANAVTDVGHVSMVPVSATLARTRVSFSVVNHRTGQKSILPTASVVSATFKRERRVLLQMVVLVVAFMLCWTPFWMLYSSYPICIHMEIQTCNYDLMAKISSIVQWLGYINSLINPLLYTGFNKEFRKPFSDLFAYLKRNLANM